MPSFTKPGRNGMPSGAGRAANLPMALAQQAVPAMRCLALSLLIRCFRKSDPDKESRFCKSGSADADQLKAVSRILAGTYLWRVLSRCTYNKL